MEKRSLECKRVLSKARVSPLDERSKTLHHQRSEQAIRARGLRRRLQGAGFPLRALDATNRTRRRAVGAVRAMGRTSFKGRISMTSDAAAVRWPERGASSACRMRGERASSGKKAQGKGLATLGARRGRRAHLTSTHPCGIGAQADRHPALRTTSGASRETVAPPSASPRMSSLRPVFFIGELVGPFSLQGSTLAWALARTKLQMMRWTDIG